jgi:LmbE family N-acetylglucosaminyl deacetylase
MQELRLLAVFPHPDDESLGMGAALARYSDAGTKTFLLCATRGEHGWPGPPEENPGPQALGRLREAELRCAADCLGLQEVSFLDYVDGAVDRAEPQEIIGAVVSHIRRIRPQVVVSFPPDGHYGHPDHIALAQFTAGALVCSADASFSDPEARAPHRVAKFYHMVDSKAEVQAVQEEIGGIRMTVDGVERNHVGWEDWAITTRIDGSPFFDRIWRAILCHRSQLPGYGPMLELPRSTLLSFFAYGYFVRIYSLVNGGRAVETDLFEGLR